MRRFLRVLSLALAFALVGGACGEDSDTTPIDEAGPGDVTDAGAEGAFGEADDCSELVGQAVAAYERAGAFCFSRIAPARPVKLILPCAGRNSPSVSSAHCFEKASGKPARPS